MKIAVPYENGMVFQHFGHTAEFKFYEVENGQVTASEVVSTNGQGHGALVDFLAQHNANAVFCGGIGPGAQNALAQAIPSVLWLEAFPAVKHCRNIKQYQKSR